MDCATCGTVLDPDTFECPNKCAKFTHLNAEMLARIGRMLPLHNAAQLARTCKRMRDNTKEDLETARAAYVSGVMQFGTKAQKKYRKDLMEHLGGAKGQSTAQAMASFSEPMPDVPRSSDLSSKAVPFFTEIEAGRSLYLLDPSSFKDWDRLPQAEQDELKAKFKIAGKTPDFVLNDLPADAFVIKVSKQAFVAHETMEEKALAAYMQSEFEKAVQSIRSNTLSKWKKYSSAGGCTAICSLDRFPSAFTTQMVVNELLSFPAKIGRGADGKFKGDAYKLYLLRSMVRTPVFFND